MAKKAELVERAKELGIKVSPKDTIAVLEAAIAGRNAFVECSAFP